MKVVQSEFTFKKNHGIIKFNSIIEGGNFMELKVICKCTACGYELEEKDMSVIIDDEHCEMDFEAKCPKCGRTESVSLPREIKMRIIHKRKNC